MNVPVAMARLRRRFGRSESGGALAEIAVILPTWMLILAGTVDLASYAWHATQLNNAVEAGVLYAASSIPSPNLPVNGWGGTSGTQIANAITNAGTGNVTVSGGAATCFFGCPTTTGIAAINEGGNPACTSTTAHTCTISGANVPAGEYVQF